MRALTYLHDHWLSLILLVCLAGTSSPACQQATQAPAERKAPPELQQNDDPGLRLVAVFNELTDILAKPHDNPGQNLEGVRDYLQQNAQRIDTIVADLEQHVLNLATVEREHYLLQHQDRLQQSIDRFAQAQKQLRAKLNDAQRIELSEVLAIIR